MPDNEKFFKVVERDSGEIRIGFSPSRDGGTMSLTAASQHAMISEAEGDLATAEALKDVLGDDIIAVQPSGRGAPKLNGGR